MKKKLAVLGIIIAMIMNMVCNVGACTQRDDTVYIPMLLYHHIQDYEVEKERYSTTVTVGEFEDHIKTLTEQGYTAISLVELDEYLKGKKKLPKKPYMISFDDGYDSNYYYAYPILKKYNIKTTIFITVGRILDSAPKRLNERTLIWMTWNQLKEMEESRLIDVQNHGFIHKPATELTLDEFIDSAVKGQRTIINKLGKRQVSTFSYPHGKQTKETNKFLVERGFNMQFTTVPKSITKKTKTNNIPRITIGHGNTGEDIIAKMKKYR